MDTLTEYRLEVIGGYMRPVFDGLEAERNELMWELLPPFPASAAALVEEVRRVGSGEIGEWIFESPGSRIICTRRSVVIESRQEEGRGHEPLRIELPFEEAASLMKRWLFECAWHEQQRRGATTSGRDRP